VPNPDIEALVESTTEIGALKRDLRTEKDKTARLVEQVGDLTRSIALAEAVQGANPQPPKWVASKAKKKHTATLCLLVTDTHLDEVVNPDEVGGLNAYNREIAMGRLERTFTGTVKFARDYLTGITIDGAVILWGGDIVSGDIHAELVESNEASTVETLVHWLEPLAAGVDLLAREFGRVHNVGVPGNHGRRQKKPRYKGRAADNFDTLLYHLLARQHVTRDEISWQVAQALYADLDIRGLRVRLEHGDEAKGGTGIASAMSPLFLLHHRRTRQYAAADRQLDLLITGHFHSRYSAPGLLVGGTLKGVDEYSTGRGFPFQEPSQEILVVGDRGVLLNAPIWSADREAEGW
jgi:hypothetical protein